ncbi:MAG: hypothetical protein EHM58_17555 [Ignavibacteriae bacterium]|nr:MAG: hypothetical protein EHM58_17555 [Ignavibacteriota bacterium]
MQYWIKVYAIVLLLLTCNNLYAQDEERKMAKYLSWSLLQLFPSPYLMQDANATDSRLNFGLRWQIIPVNISFHANKYVSPAQFFMINPVRRFSGSVEMFVQPEASISGFKYAGFNKLGVSSGIRFVLPLKGEGEHLSYSIGGKVNFREPVSPYYSLELGIYSIYSMVGLQLNYNFISNNRINVGIFLKYF